MVLAQFPASSRPPDSRKQEMLRNLRRQIELVVLDTSPDSVHDLRVAIRRLQEADAETDADTTPEATAAKAQRRALLEIFHAAGVVRDHDVTAELLAKSALSTFALDKQIAEGRDQSAQALREILIGPATRAQLIALPEHAANLSAKYLTGLAKDFFRHGSNARKTTNAKKLHRFRIAAKHFRYALERLGPAGDPPFTERLPFTEQLEDLQNALGQINDCQTALRLLNSAAPKALLHWLKRRKRKQIEHFQSAWRKLRPHKKTWLRTLAASL